VDQGRGRLRGFDKCKQRRATTGHTENDDVPDPHVLQRAPAAVHEDVVELVKRIKALDDAAEHGVLPVEVVDVVRERDEELAARAARVRRDGHADRPARGVLQAREELRLEVPRHGRVRLGPRGGGRGEVGPDGLAARAGRARVARLREEVLGHCGAR
jgi:hypothetical protein